MARHLLACLALITLCAAAAGASMPWPWTTSESIDNTIPTAGMMEVDSAGACHVIYMTNRDYGLCRWVVRVGPGQWVNALNGQPWNPNAPVDNLSQTVFPRIAIDHNRNVYMYSATNYDSSLVIKKFAYAGSNTWSLVASTAVPGFQGRVGSVRVSPAGDIGVGMSNFPYPPGIAICRNGEIMNPSAWSSYVSWDYNDDFQFDGAGNIHLLSNGDYGYTNDGYLVLFLDYWYKKYSPTMQLLNTPIKVTDANTDPQNGSRIFDRSLALDGNDVYTCFRIAGYLGTNNAWMWKIMGGTQLVGPINLTPLPSYGPGDACGNAYVYGKNGNIAVGYVKGTVYQNPDIPHTIHAYDVTGDRRSDSLNPGMRTTGILGALDSLGNFYVNGRGDYLIFGALPGPVGMGTLNGFVRDQQGIPIGSATISLHGPNNFEKLGYSNPDGSFRIGAIPPATYDVSAWKLGYTTDTQPGVVLAPNQTTTRDFTIGVYQGSFSGYVRDPQGAPIAGAMVTATGIGTYQASTDASGHYVLSGIAVGPYTISAYKFGCHVASAARSLAHNGDAVQQDFTLVQWIVSEAKLLADYAPVELVGKVVTAVFPGDSCIYVQEPDRTGAVRVASTAAVAVGDRVTVAGSAGTRVISGCPAEREINNATITKQSSGAAPRAFGLNCRAVGGGPIGSLVRGVQGGSGLNNIGLLVRTAGRVTTKVGQYIYVDDGSNVQDVAGRVGVMVKCPSTSIPVDVGYTVTVTGIVVGSVPAGWSANRRMIQLRDYTDLVASHVYVAAGSISGTVRNASGAGLGGVTVSTDTGGYTTTTATDGAYTLVGLPVGSYDVTASKSGHVAQTNYAVQVAADQTTTSDFTLQLTPGVISGTVKDPSGTDVSGALVSVSPGGYSATTGSNGAYSISGVQPGTYSVTASKSGYSGQTQSSASVTSGQTTTVNLTLTPLPGSISGLVRDGSGTAVSGATVATSTGGYSTTSAADGSYALSSVIPGTYDVTASKTGYVSQTKTGTAVGPGQAVSLQFTINVTPGAIAGFVRNQAAAPLAGANVSTTSGGYTTTSASDGSYTLSGLTPGTYSVTASKVGYVSHTNNGVLVTTGQTTSAVNFGLAVASATEKLVNGDIESGFFNTGWNIDCSAQPSRLPNPSGTWGWNNEGTYPFNAWDSTGIRHGGSHALGFSFCQSAASPGKLGVATQSVNLGSANASATFSIWAYHTNGNCPAIMCWNPGAGQGNPYTAATTGRYQFVSTDVWGQVNTWTTRSMLATADSSGWVTVMVGGAAWPGTPAACPIYIDDISVK